jgi:hypothetical protein
VNVPVDHRRTKGNNIPLKLLLQQSVSLNKSMKREKNENDRLTPIGNLTQ